MYIIGMRYGKNIEKLEMTPTEILVGVVVPFVLFWGGILSPFYTSDILVWIFSLVPFYGYMFVCGFTSEKTEERIVGVPSVLNVVTSLLLLCVFFFLPEEYGMLRNTCKMGILNILPSISILFLVSMDCLVDKTCKKPLIPYVDSCS